MSFSTGCRNMKRLVKKRKQALKSENEPKQIQQVAKYEREGKKEEGMTDISCIFNYFECYRLKSQNDINKGGQT